MDLSDSRSRILGFSVSIIKTVVFLFTFSILSSANGQVNSCRELFNGSSKKVVIEATATFAEAYHPGRDVRFPVRLVKIRSPLKKSFLHSLEPIELASDAKLFLYVTDGNGKRTRVTLPANMDSKIIDYLRAGAPPTAPFDCNCFAHFVNGVDYIFGRLDNSKWRNLPFDGEENLKPGSTIFIGYDRMALTHLAIYLGAGLYLSKFGAAGPLIIADLDSMKLGFGGDEVYIGEPMRDATIRDF